MKTNKHKRAHRRKRNQIARQLHEGRTGPYRSQAIDHDKLKKKLKRDKRVEHMENELDDIDEMDTDLGDNVPVKTV